ncbi:MAG: AraC family transcriptional regulator [Desulfovibrio sp.]|nr:MAG: AraC family transcriptional regulator [Desulfovibrio sp.]
MSEQPQGMPNFVRLLEELAPEEGIFPAPIDKLVTFRVTHTYGCKPQVYEPGFIFGAQGKKHIHLEGRQYNYSAGNFMAVFAPMPFECEVIEASPDKPLLGMAILLDSNRLTKLLLKMDRGEAPPAKSGSGNVSGIVSGPINAQLMDAVIRLLTCLKDPAEAAVLGDAIIDEIYFRIISHERGGALATMLQQRGQIQQISKAVDHVHRNLDKPVAVEELAAIVNMSASGFHKKFKEVMHLSPLQYAKSIKLNRAQSYILEGRSVSEAGAMVGYNSMAQFSREYKRHFGMPPSEHARSPEAVM